MARSRRGLAASFFPARDARADLPGDRAVAFTARVPPSVLRPASEDRRGRAARRPWRRGGGAGRQPGRLTDARGWLLAQATTTRLAFRPLRGEENPAA